MPTINKTVDKTTVNGSETFIYTFNVSFSGLSTPALNGKIVDFFPSKIRYQLPPIGGQLVSINQIPVAGGTNVEFNFGSVTAGTSISFTMSCQFGPGREQGDSFTNTADLYADTVKVATVTAPTVNLILDNNFRLVKLARISGPVKPDEEVTFNLILENSNDPGYRINNVVFTDVLPSQLIPVTSFLPVGTDTSIDSFSDKTYDGRTGSFTGNTLNFTLPSYNGSSYTIVFKAKVATSVTPGQSISNTANWTISGTAQTPTTATFTVFQDVAKAVFIKRGPLYAVLNEGIQYSIATTNTGTVVLNNVDIIDTAPNEVNFTKLSFTASTVITNTYSLYIATSEAPNVYKTVATNISGTSIAYDLTPLIPLNQRVVKVKATLSNLNPINQTAAMFLYGVVNSTATLNQVITNKADLTSTSTLGNVTATSSVNTTLNGKSILKINKFVSPNASAYYPLNEFRFGLSASAQKGMVTNPVISDLLPLGIEYVPGNEFYLYTDALTFTNYDSRNPGFPVPLPTIQVIKNYQNTGRTLVRYRFNNFILQYMNSISVNFTVLVKLNPPNSFVNYGYLGNPGDNTEVDGTSYLDSNDLDGDGITNENIAQSNPINGTILTTSEFSLEKWVRGDLDLDYSKAASVMPGGDITYKLNVTNNQDVDLKNIQLVDILPYPGDTGVILNTIPRGSQYTVYATSVVTAEIVNILGDPVDPNPLITIEYSTSNNPIRFNEQGTGTIGTGTWSLIPPIDVTTIRSIKVTTDPSVILKPYERLIVTINAKAPTGASVNTTAYNSYAVRADKISGGVTTPMNPTEPNKVSAQIRLATLSGIGNLVFIDANKNGLYEPSEVGLNGVTVELYDENMNLLKTTVTANNNLNQPGYYNFNELVAANYFVKFIPYGIYTLTTQQLVVNGSKPNQVTGLTNLITLGENETNNTIIAGVVEPAKASIGNLVFIDANKNGLYEPGEVGLNGVTVELYDENMNLLKTTVTVNNNLNQPGYYNFNELVSGNYFVKFIPFGDYTLTTQQLVVNGSKPNQVTGLTNLITLGNGEINNTIIAGVVQPPKGEIGNLVFIDANKNGLYEPGEVGLNGITIELYDENMNLLKTTITANNNLNQPGYYNFNGLEAGNYFVKFIPFGNYLLTTQKLVVNGSKPSQITGITNLITLANDETNNTIIAGVFACNPPTIIASNKCIYLNQAFNPMSGVTAIDCQGNNITSSIIITANDVNPSVVGIYHVTYSVTDSRDQTTIKTITVKVCKNGARIQSIIDIYESVALEQTALSHILNAEGEKLQKILSLNLTSQEVLVFNQSVNKTVNLITSLEVILSSKLELFKGSSSLDCCSK